MGILLSLLLQQRAPGGRPCSARSPLPEEGVHQKRATGWRTLSPTPAGSGKSARPVPAGRGTLTTGSVYAAPRRAASVSVTGARNDKDKERILSLLEEIWQDDSWLPAA